jgi:hypothetical protein
MKRGHGRFFKWAIFFQLIFLTLPAVLTLPFLLLLVKLRVVSEAAGDRWIEWVTSQITGGVMRCQRPLIRRQIRGKSREEVENQRLEFEQNLQEIAQQRGRPDAFANVLSMNRALEEAEMARTGA